ncbi:MAG: glycosyltransferase family 2 protein [Bacteroidetes bacterium]|nr:glycosyltransferase family 2 protein [Bacteroidota bacterium]MCL5025717.1 glycosyltransferase family 2 protein [Chloroflexota bacterium]
MWRDRTVSLVLPTYNEKDSICECIQDFLEQGVVDEIVVVNNNAAPGTSEEVARAGDQVVEVHEPLQGYGYAVRRGLSHATGYYLLVAEPDGTFLGRDALKLLAYSDDFEVVYGSRTARELIWQGANMGWFLKWGNWAAAKLMEFLFNTPNLTDVGCTLRLLTRPALERIQPYFSVGGSHFGPEMMLLTMLHGSSVIQIPVNYRQRVGVSMATGSLRKTLAIGIRMIILIFSYRLGSWTSRDRRYGHRRVGRQLRKASE